MHYFWKGDMQHFSPPLPFQRGRAECRRLLARDLGGPEGVPARAGLRQSPNPRGQRVVDLGGPERGARGCRAVVVPRPPQPARRRPRPARVGRQRVPGCGGP